MASGKGSPTAGHEPELVWYVSYGSNLSRDRFMCYIEGGTPPGSQFRMEGCTDRTPPREDRMYMLPHRMYFAGSSSGWGGSVAFLDHDSIDPEGPDVAYGRAWLITREQFEQVVAQECGRSSRSASKIDLAKMTQPGLKKDSSAGRYATVRSYGEIDGHVMVTCTTDQSQDQQTKQRRLGGPSPSYMWTIARGLRECSDLTDEQITAYLASRPGADGNVDDKIVAAAVTAKDLREVLYLQRFKEPATGLSDKEIDDALRKAAEQDRQNARWEAAAQARRELERRRVAWPGTRFGSTTALGTGSSASRSQGALFDRVPGEPDPAGTDPFDRDLFDDVWADIESTTAGGFGGGGGSGFEGQAEFIDEAATEFGWDDDVLAALDLPGGLDPDELVEVIESVHESHSANRDGTASFDDLHVLEKFAPTLLDVFDESGRVTDDEATRVGLAEIAAAAGSDPGGVHWVKGYRRRNPKTGKVEFVSGYDRRVPPQNRSRR